MPNDHFTVTNKHQSPVDISILLGPNETTVVQIEEPGADPSRTTQVILGRHQAERLIAAIQQTLEP
jgi:uncharacterized protein YejL (UPF0352 family)